MHGQNHIERIYIRKELLQNSHSTNRSVQQNRFKDFGIKRISIKTLHLYEN